MLRQAIGGLVFRDRLHQAIQGVGPELHAVDIGAQVFMTGADPAAFADVAAVADGFDVFTVSPGRVERSR